MPDPAFADRLDSLIKDRYKNPHAFAKAIGWEPSLVRKYLNGTEPGVSNLAKIAAFTGVRLEWLILGEGPREPPSQTSEALQGSPAASLDADLLGRVVDRIARVYRELGIGLPDVQLGQLAAEKYAEIQAFAADRDEWPPALDLMAVRLRKALLQAAAEPGSTKSRA